MGIGLGILGTKVGMTQLFDADERLATPVTVIHAEPNVVLRRFTQDADGYSSVQVGYKDQRATRTNRPHAGQFARASEASGQTISPKKVIRQWRLDADPGDDLSIGSTVTVELFDGVTFIDVTGISKGKGTQGVMKKYNFKGNVRTHGTHEFFRHGGSIGTRLTPGHVHRGKKMPGRMGNVRVTTQNLRLHSVDVEKNLLFIVGAVPGCKGSVIEIRRAIKRS
jgi:large subunit ribosomal protein L3